MKMNPEAMTKDLINEYMKELIGLVDKYYDYADKGEGYLCREVAIEICGKIEGMNDWMMLLNIINK